MKAAMLYGAGDIRIEEVQTPKPGPGQVLVKIEACGICGGDYRGFKHAKPKKEGSLFGHEAAGTIVELVGSVDGPGADGIRVGDRVALSPGASCGNCRPCKRGMRHYCQDRPLRGVYTGGGFAEYKLVLPSQCYKIPDSLAFSDASMAEPVACCLYASGRADISPGDRVAILGAGANALAFVQIALIRGAEYVLVADTIESRLAVAKSLGASKTVNTEFLEIPDDESEGYDLVIVTRGKAEFTQAAVQYCAPGGRILCYGVSPAGVAASIEPHKIWRNEITLVGSRSFSDTYGEAVNRLSSGQIKVDSIVTSKVPLDEFASALAESPEGHIKAVVLPGSIRGRGNE